MFPDWAPRTAPLPYRAGLLGVLVVAIYYGGHVTNGSFNFLQPEPYDLGLAFNSMIVNLLHGRFDVAFDTIGHEGFVRDGRTYSYFGIFPALLRLPLVPYCDMETLRVERLSCWLAMMVGGFGQAAAAWITLRHTPEGPGKRMLMVPLLLVAIGSGPAVMLSSKVSIYHEVVLWAWAQAMVFVALALHGLLSGRFSTRLLSAMAVIAGLCVITRPSTAFGLYAALGLVMVCITIRDRSRFIGLLLPAALAGLFILASGVVNYGRWGNPLVFADMTLQLMTTIDFPDRLTRLERYGLFHMDRLWMGLGYYFFPIWIWVQDGHFIFQSSISEMFDAFELPPSSLFLSDPLTLGLAGAGLVWLARGRMAVDRFSTGAVLSGLAIPAAAIVIYQFMAFRYRVEFMPVMVAAACLAAGHWADRLNAAPPAAVARSARLVWTLAVFQVVSAHCHRLIYQITPLGPSDKFAAIGLDQVYWVPFARAFGLEP